MFYRYFKELEGRKHSYLFNKASDLLEVEIIAKIQSHADIHEKDSSGKSIFMVLCQKGYNKAFEEVDRLELPYNETATNHRGSTSLLLAVHQYMRYYNENTQPAVPIPDFVLRSRENYKKIIKKLSSKNQGLINVKNKLGFSALNCFFDDPVMLLFLLSLKPCLDDQFEPFNDQISPLMLAVESGSLHSVKILVQYGVNIFWKNFTGKTALMFARDRVTILLITQDNKYGPLVSSTEEIVDFLSTSEQKQILRFMNHALIQARFKCSEFSKFVKITVAFWKIYAQHNKSLGDNKLRSERLGIFNILSDYSQQNNNNNADEDADVLKFLQSHEGVSGDMFDRHSMMGKAQSILTMVCERGLYHSAEYLINKGASLNGDESSTVSVLMDVIEAIDLEPSQENSSSKPAEGHLQRVIWLLLSKGADINHQDEYGFTPLLLAAQTSVATITILFEHSERVEKKLLLDKTSSSGETALMTACQIRSYEIAELLVGKGANINLINEEGNTAYSIAKSQGNCPLHILTQLEPQPVQEEIENAGASSDAVVPQQDEAQRGKRAAPTEFFDSSGNKGREEQDKRSRVDDKAEGDASGSDNEDGEGHQQGPQFGK